MTADATLLAIVAAVFAFAGFIKGVIGLGLPTIATGMLGIVMIPVQAASIVVLPALLTNIWQMWSGPGLLMLLRRLWPMLVCVIAGTIATAGIVTRGNTRISVAMLGVALMAYALYALIVPRFHIGPDRERIWGILAGLATGVISGATGVFVVPTVPYLQAIDFDKDELVQAIGITAFTSAFALAIGLGLHGSLSGGVAAPAAVAVVASFVGMGIGQALRDRLSLDLFRRAVLIGLFGLGVAMVARLLG